MGMADHIELRPGDHRRQVEELDREAAGGCQAPFQCRHHRIEVVHVCECVIGEDQVRTAEFVHQCDRLRPAEDSRCRADTCSICRICQGLCQFVPEHGQASGSEMLEQSSISARDVDHERSPAQRRLHQDALRPLGEMIGHSARPAACMAMAGVLERVGHRTDIAAGREPVTQVRWIELYERTRRADPHHDGGLRDRSRKASGKGFVHQRLRPEIQDRVVEQRMARTTSTLRSSHVRLR